MNDICFVSVGTNQYFNNVLRLENCLKKLKLDYIIWKNEYPPNSPTHNQVPYSFKVYAIEHALEKGYKKIFWLDSSFVIVRDIEPIYQILEKEGCFFYQDMTHFNNPPVQNRKLSVGAFCKDDALIPLDITREESFDIPQILAGCMGYNFESKRTQECFNKISQLVKYNDGEILKGPHHNFGNSISKDSRVLGHRHDLIVVSVVIHKSKMPTWYPGLERDMHSNNPLYIQYENWPPKSNDVIFILKRN